jgi:hypothetical protein
MMYQPRTYRNLVNRADLISFRLVVKETDLFIHSTRATRPLEDIARESILKHRGFLESYIRTHPEFAETMKPWRISGPAPIIVREMAVAGQKAGVGPMAAVAGVIAERVGTDLLDFSEKIIVENGGDIFLKTESAVTVGIFAGKSPLSLRIGLRIDPRGASVAVCTSSGSVGHSLSLGKADAVCVVSPSCPLADAAATSIGNRVKTKKDVRKAIDYGKTIEGVEGVIVIVGDEIGVWGDIEIIPLKGKKG